MLQGIDVSSWQGVVNWEQVREAGYRFAFCKATQGATYVDPRFLANIKGARAANVITGGYHYAQPDSGVATVEADHFCAVVDRAGGVDLPLVLDLETGTGRLDAWAAAFLAQVEKHTGKTPILYSYAPFLSQHITNAELARFPLWVAAYTDRTPGRIGVWPRWTFWQNSDKGRVPGVGGNVDVDQFNGDEAALRALCGLQPTPTPDDSSGDLLLWQ